MIRADEEVKPEIESEIILVSSEDNLFGKNAGSTII